LYTPLLVVVVALSTIAFVEAIMGDVYGPPAVGFTVYLSPLWAGGFWLVLVLRRKRLSQCLTGFFVWSVVVVGACYLMSLGCVDPCQISREWVCSMNLKQIGLALQSYEQRYGCFPPAYITGENGKPTHSWRALILPYMEDDSLCKRYNFSEPWDGPENKLLLNEKHQGFICPADWFERWPEATYLTSYVAVVGTKGAWRGDKPLKISDLRDGASKTILVIEVANSDIPWTEPRDLSWDAIHKMANARSRMAISPKHQFPKGFFFKDSPGGVQALRADGSVTFLPANFLTADHLEKALSLGGAAEAVLLVDPTIVNLNWWNCTVFLVWTLSVYLLLRRWSLALRDSESLDRAASSGA
jgi:hypothetical protein